MSIPLEILFHGLDKSEAAEARIRDKIDRLHRHFDRITHARVVIETPRRHTAAAKVFQVKIEIGLPGQKPLIVRHDPPAEQTISIAIRDAFAAARRRLDDVAAKIKHPAKRERTRRRPARIEVAQE